ncbi:MAG: CPBP family intramembrane metalloprotease [Myxococcales bacterium]|jgi:membrane protease YdiL (CAAX protease family)|nr:CPBP family intramembrane metalloprotease [Myxococcales bacterium]
MYLITVKFQNCIAWFSKFFNGDSFEGFGNEWYFLIIKIIYLGFALIIMRYVGGLSPKQLGITIDRNKKTFIFWFASSVGFAILVMCFYILLINIYSYFIGVININFLSIVETLNKLSSYDIINHFFISPIFEEIFFRAILCSVFAYLCGWNVSFIVVTNGLLFSIAHFYYGNPDPANLVGGYFLAWSFCISRSVITPIMFHIIGNALCFFPNIISTFYPTLILDVTSKLNFF